MIRLRLMLLICVSTATNAATISKAVVYQNILTQNSSGQTLSQIVVQNPDFRPDFILRSYFKWGSQSPTGWRKDFNQLKTVTTELTKANPNLIFQGGITASYLKINPDYLSGKSPNASSDIWADDHDTALSNADFFSMTLKDAQGNPVFYDAAKTGYVADITSGNFRKFIIGWCKRQMAHGMTSLFFDEPFAAADRKIAANGRNLKSEEIAAIYNKYSGAFNEIAVALRAFAQERHQLLLIGKNDGRLNGLMKRFQKYPELIQGDDLLLGTFEDNDFSSQNGVVEDFAQVRAFYDKTMGRKVPIVLFIDWPSAMSKFTALSSDQQNALLINLDKAAQSGQMVFAYPVYGGVNHDGVVYDSAKVRTFDTIAKLLGQRR